MRRQGERLRYVDGEATRDSSDGIGIVDSLRNRRGVPASEAEPAKIREVRGVRATAPLGRLAFAGVSVLALLVVGGCWAMAAGGPNGPLQAFFHRFDLYLPVADVSVNLLLLLALGFAVGVLSGMTGVSGSFLLTPLLMVMGVPATTAVGTGATQSVGTAASGSLVHWRMRNVDVRLGLVVVIGGLIGGSLGVRLVAVLQAAGDFDFWVKVVYVLVSGTVGILTLRESLGELLRRAKARRVPLPAGAAPEQLGAVGPAANGTAGGGMSLARLTAGWPLQVEFGRAKMRTSLLAPFALGFVVAALSAIMGVGGGFVMVPAMIYLLGIPTHVAVGTTLFQMVFIASSVGFQQAATNHNVDVALAVLLMIGAAIGSEIGGRIGRVLDGCQLRVALGAVVCLVMVHMAVDVVLCLFAPSGAAAARMAPPPHEVGVLAALGKMAVDSAAAYGALSVVTVILVGLGLTGLLGSTMPRIVAYGMRTLSRAGFGWLRAGEHTIRPERTADGATSLPRHG